jgi:hypothetical protein
MEQDPKRDGGCKLKTIKAISLRLGVFLCLIFLILDASVWVSLVTSRTLTFNTKVKGWADFCKPSAPYGGKLCYKSVTYHLGVNAMLMIITVWLMTKTPQIRGSFKNYPQSFVILAMGGLALALIILRLADLNNPEHLSYLYLTTGGYYGQ